ncbi:MAG: hypothetical protein II045_00395 [Oscillospiraceae bacterium]|nr:hypothetical protein [Oscillospiraceae bacterium]
MLSTDLIEKLLNAFAEKPLWQVCTLVSSKIGISSSGKKSTPIVNGKTAFSKQKTPELLRFP